MLSVMTQPTPKPKLTGVRLSVTVSTADYERLVAVKGRLRTKTGKVVSTQELVAGWITERLDKIESE